MKIQKVLTHKVRFEQGSEKKGGMFSSKEDMTSEYFSEYLNDGWEVVSMQLAGVGSIEMNVIAIAVVIEKIVPG